METKMKMMTRAEKEEVRESESEKETERREGRHKRGETERQNTDIEPKHLCSCAKHFQDHKRLLVQRSKQALSRRLQHPQKKLAQRLDSLVRVSRRVVRDQKKVHVSWSITGAARNGRLWRARTPSICE